MEEQSFRSPDNCKFTGRVTYRIQALIAAEAELTDPQCWGLVTFSFCGCSWIYILVLYLIIRRIMPHVNLYHNIWAT